MIKDFLEKTLLIPRIKAFITDIFMIYMPILYVATYGVLGSKEALWESQWTIFACVALYIVILSLFFARNGQSLGYKYAQIALRKENGAEIGLATALIRNVIFCVSFGLIFGVFVPLVRKDRRFLHDILSKTKVELKLLENP
ncbi:RDD family protein [Helicobacter sp. 23-1045]